MQTVARSLGRILRRGGLVVRANTAACCCPDDGGPGLCVCVRTFLPPCAGDEPTLCCEAREYDATITASGSAAFSVDLQYWDGGLLFPGAGGAIPPAPADGVIYQGEWSQSETITRRCVDANGQSGINGFYRSTGTLTVQGFYWGVLLGNWQQVPFSLSRTWSNVVVGNVFDLAINASRNIQVFGNSDIGSLSSAYLGLFPARTAPVNGCVETYPDGSLLVANLFFAPDLQPFNFPAGGTRLVVQTTGSNTCAVRSQSALAQWTILSFPLAPSGGLEAAGGGLQQYNWHIAIQSQGCPTPECLPTGPLGAL